MTLPAFYIFDLMEAGTPPSCLHMHTYLTLQTVRDKRHVATMSTPETFRLLWNPILGLILLESEV